MTWILIIWFIIVYPILGLLTLVAHEDVYKTVGHPAVRITTFFLWPVFMLALLFVGLAYVAKWIATGE